MPTGIFLQGRWPAKHELPTQQMRCYDVISRPAGRRDADQEMRLAGENTINARYCIKYHLKPPRIKNYV